ncbi:hypothetical protein SESBI_32887 [Sesbania bispinosa]|nr:hypothetical protein SESBI_32887 [Sesbania bispinosa]
MNKKTQMKQTKPEKQARESPLSRLLRAHHLGSHRSSTAAGTTAPAPRTERTVSAATRHCRLLPMQRNRHNSLPAAASLPSHHRVVPLATRPPWLASPSACAAMVVRPPPWASLFPNLVSPN